MKRNFDIILKERIVQSFDDAFKGDYELSVEKVTTSILTGSAIVSGLTLKSKPLPDNGFLDSKIDALELSGISWKKLIKEKQINFNKVGISSPDIFFREPLNKEKQNDFLQLLPKFLSELSHSVNIRHFEIKNGKVSYVTGDINDKTINSASDINLVLGGISVMNGKEPYIISENVFISLKNLCLEKENRKALSISSLTVDSEKSHLKAENISLDNLPIKGFNTSGFVKSIFTEDIKIPKSLHEYKLKANKITFSNGDLNIVETFGAPLAKTSLILPEEIHLNDIGFEKINVKIKAYNKDKKNYYSGVLESVNIESIEKKPDKNFRISNIEFAINNFEMTDQLHQSLKVNVISGSSDKNELFLSNIKFNQNESTLKPGVNLKINKIAANSIDYKNFQNSDLRANCIVFDKPEVEVSFSSDITTNEKNKQSFNSLIEKFTEDYFQNTGVNKILVKDGRLQLNYHNGDDQLNQSFSGVNIETGAFKLNQNSIDQPLNSSNLSAFIANYEIASDQANFILKAQNVSGEGKSGKISGTNITINQKRSNGQEQPYYFNTSIESFAANEINFHKLLNSTAVQAGKLEAKGMNLLVDLDETKSSEGHGSVLPKDIFQLVPFAVDIGELSVVNSRIHYKNRIGGHYNQSELSFENLSIQSTRLTNNPEYLSATELKINGLLNGKGSFKFNATIPFMSPSFSCKYNGSLGAMEGIEFNNWLAYADIGIRKGRLDDLTFSVEIADGKAKASVAMLYQDLRLDVFNKNNGKKKKLTSFLSRIVIHKNNKAGKRPAEAVYVRCNIPADYGFFYSIWHPIKEGMTQTVTKDFYIPSM